MYLENYSVRIFKDDRSPTAETKDGYVSLVNGEKYRVRLNNQTNKECFCDLKIDGKSIGKFYIKANSKVEIERPENDSGRLTFYTVDSKEGKELQLSTEISKSELGLITAEFVPIKPEPPRIRTNTNMALYKSNVKHFGSYSHTTTNMSDGMDGMIDFAPAVASMDWMETADYSDVDDAPEVRYRGIPSSAKVGGTGLSGESTVDYKDINISADRFLTNEAVKIHLRLIGVETYSTVRKLVSSVIRETSIPAPV